MKALVFRGKKNVSYETIPDPQIEQPSDVIVAVRSCAICGSDLHPYHEWEVGLLPGTAMGHEFSGEIVDVGAEVHQFKLGDLVFSPFTVSCGHCFSCQHDLSARCDDSQVYGWIDSQHGGLHGAQAEYVRVPLADSTLLKIPDGMTDEQAILLGDNFTTGFFCADMAEIHSGGIYVVIGCGAVGISAIVAAQHMGARCMIAVDQIDSRLELASQVGATSIARPEDAQNVLQQEIQQTGQRGADAVMEAVGSPHAQRLALSLLRPGGTLAVVGVHTDPHFAFAPVDAYDANLTYKTGRCSVRSFLDRVMPLVVDGTISLPPVITHRMPLGEGVAAYDQFDKKRNGCVKIVLSPDN